LECIDFVFKVAAAGEGRASEAEEAPEGLRGSLPSSGGKTQESPVPCVLQHPATEARTPLTSEENPDSTISAAYGFESDSAVLTVICLRELVADGTLKLSRKQPKQMPHVFSAVTIRGTHLSLRCQIRHPCTARA
jgi:hypothetical protein